MSRRLRALMEAEGLEYGNRTHTYNSRLAQELAVAADEAGRTDAMHDALFRAYFVEGLDVSAPEVLTAAGRTAGLAPETIRFVIEDRGNEATVDAHWTRARSFGITGVPTFVAGGFGVVGAQPYETLERLMERIGVPRR
jgi:predicted DsbA family dithiol-disulfide isomerase